MPFKFNPISGQFDLVNAATTPGGSDTQFQYNNGGAFGGASAAGYDDTANRVNIGDQTGTYAFFPTDDTKLEVSNLITSIGTSFSPIDIIKLLDATSVTVNPSADTNSGLGITIYGAKGFNLRTDGNKKFNGGPPIGVTQLNTSLLGAFGQMNYFSTAGSTLDTGMGVLCNSTHGGYGGAASTLIGGTFSATTSDDAGGGAATGSLSLAIGGIFTAGIEDNGVSITSAIAGKFIEPLVLGGSGTITNKTAAWIDGTYSITRSTVASAASITNMAVATSYIEITGSTATAIHGIHADTFAKEIIIYNATNTTVTLKNQSGTEGTAANRIITGTGGDLVIPTGKSVRLYDNQGVSRWIVNSNQVSVASPNESLQFNNAGVFGASTVLWQPSYVSPDTNARPRMWFPDTDYLAFGDGSFSQLGSTAAFADNGAGGLRLTVDSDDLSVTAWDFKNFLLAGIFNLPAMINPLAGVIGPYLYVQDADMTAGQSTIIVAEPTNSIFGANFTIVVADAPNPITFETHNAPLSLINDQTQIAIGDGANGPVGFLGLDLQMDTRLFDTKVLYFGGTIDYDTRAWMQCNNGSGPDYLQIGSMGYTSLGPYQMMTFDLDNNKIGFFQGAPVAQQTFGAATAGATYTATEQAMLQKCYDAFRNFSLAT